MSLSKNTHLVEVQEQVPGSFGSPLAFEQYSGQYLDEKTKIGPRLIIYINDWKDPQALIAAQYSRKS